MSKARPAIESHWWHIVRYSFRRGIVKSLSGRKVIALSFQIWPRVGPIAPHTVQTTRGPKEGVVSSSANLPTSMIAWWCQCSAPQVIESERTFCWRMLHHVTKTRLAQTEVGRRHTDE